MKKFLVIKTSGQSNLTAGHIAAPHGQFRWYL